MDFNVFSAGEISGRYVQSRGDGIKHIWVYVHSADNSSGALLCNDSSHSFLRCYRPRSDARRLREAGEPNGNITLTRIAFVARVCNPVVALREISLASP